MKCAERTARFANAGTSAWQSHEIGAQRQRAGEDVILLTIGNTDFATPPEIADAATASLAAGRTGYEAIEGEPSLREAIAQRYRERSRTSIDASQVLITIGAQNALFTAAMCIADHGDEILVPEPVYVTYPGLIAASGARIVTVPTSASSGFHPDLEAMEAAITPKTRAIFFASPNNPTGAVYSLAELTAIGDMCKRHDLWLVSDEVYSDLVYDGEHVSPASIPGLSERTIIIGSLSKSHAMAGWRLGWLIAPEQMSNVAGRLSVYSTFGVPTFIQDAAVRALEVYPDGMSRIREAYDRRRRALCDRLNQEQGFTCRPPEAGMFVMLDISELGVPTQDFALGLIHETGVATLPADGFGVSTNGFLRISLGVADEKLGEAAERIANYAAKLRATSQMSMSV